MESNLLEKQFAIDFGCKSLNKNENVFVTNTSSLDTRYWARGKGTIVCFNNHLFVRTEESALTNELREIYQDKKSAWFFEMDNIEKIMTLLNKYQLKITRLAPFFIPSKKLKLTCLEDSRFVFLTQEETQNFQEDKRIKEAFCYSEKDPDKLGLAYYEENELKAICGANKNGKYIWELGIEILDEEFKGKGIATRLIQNLTAKIQEDYPEIIPVYGTAFSHTQSINVAINAGFKLGWSELIIGK